MAQSHYRSLSESYQSMYGGRKMQIERARLASQENSKQKYIPEAINYLIRENYASNAQAAEAILDVASDAWLKQITEDLSR